MARTRTTAIRRAVTPPEGTQQLPAEDPEKKLDPVEDPQQIPADDPEQNPDLTDVPEQNPANSTLDELRERVFDRLWLTMFQNAFDVRIERQIPLIVCLKNEALRLPDVDGTPVGGYSVWPGETAAEEEYVACFQRVLATADTLKGLPLEERNRHVMLIDQVKIKAYLSDFKSVRFLRSSYDYHKLIRKLDPTPTSPYLAEITRKLPSVRRSPVVNFNKTVFWRRHMGPLPYFLSKKVTETLSEYCSKSLCSDGEREAVVNIADYLDPSNLNEMYPSLLPFLLPYEKETYVPSRKLQENPPSVPHRNFFGPITEQPSIMVQQTVDKASVPDAKPKQTADKASVPPNTTAQAAEAAQEEGEHELLPKRNRGNKHELCIMVPVVVTAEEYRKKERDVSKAWKKAADILNPLIDMINEYEKKADLALSKKRIEETFGAERAKKYISLKYKADVYFVVVFIVHLDLESPPLKTWTNTIEKPEGSKKPISKLTTLRNKNANKDIMSKVVKGIVSVTTKAQEREKTGMNPTGNAKGNESGMVDRDVIQRIVTFEDIKLLRDHTHVIRWTCAVEARSIYGQHYPLSNKN